jgi:hypothetical protein
MLFLRSTMFGAAGLLLWGALLQCGCINVLAAKEPYPHPYAKHRNLPFSEENVSPPLEPLTSSLRLAICDPQSQAVSPLGGYFVAGQLTRLLEPIACERELADVIRDQLSARGVRTFRLPGETGDVLLLTSDVRGTADLLLKGTILGMEFSQHGDKNKPYDLFYVAVRFCLVRATDGETVWQGQVAACLKLPPDPQSSALTFATRAAQSLAEQLMDSASFRGSLAAQAGRS